MKKFKLLGVILFLSFMMGAIPAIYAQDTPTDVPTVEASTPVPTAEATPVVTPTPAPEPAPVNWFTTVSPWVVILLIVIAVAVATLGHTAIVQLGASVPVAFWEIGKGAVVSGLDQLGGYVTTTPTAIDNEAYTELRKQFDALVKEVATLRQTQAQNIKRIDAVEVTTQALK